MKTGMRLAAALGVTGATLAAGPAYAGDLWASSAWFPQSGTDASNSCGVIGSVGHEAGLVPPFRAAERDRLTIGGEAGAGLGRVQLGVAWSWLRDAPAAAEAVSGPGDARVGTVVTVARAGDAGRSGRVTLGWEAKLPNARDEGELGTDETDVLLGVGAEGAWGRLDARVAAGLGILGNPLRFANQDDVPMVRAELGARVGPVRVAPALVADLATSRNTARVSLGGEILAGESLFGRLGGAAGLTPAAADWSVTVGLGWRVALPDGPEGE